MLHQRIFVKMIPRKVPTALTRSLSGKFDVTSQVYTALICLIWKNILRWYPTLTKPLLPPAPESETQRPTAQILKP